MPRSSTWATITATNGGFAGLVAPGVRKLRHHHRQSRHSGARAGNIFTLDFYGGQTDHARRQRPDRRQT